MPQTPDSLPPYIREESETPRGRRCYRVVAPDGSSVARLEIDADLWHDRYLLTLYDVLDEAARRHAVCASPAPELYPPIVTT